MSPITLELPDELAERLRPLRDRLPRILELGLRQLDALPTPEEILALRPGPAFQARLRALLEKSRMEGLSPDEEVEWQRFQYLEHLVRTAKAKAALRLKAG